MQETACAHERIAEVFKAVADPTRVRILATILHAGELCVCDVESALGLTQSRASRQLAALKRAGLVVDRRVGAWAHYGVARRPDELAKAVLAAVRKTTAADPGLVEDVARARSARGSSSCDGGAR